MKELLVFAALLEALTGLALLAYPPLVIRLLFNSNIAGAGALMSHLAGISLIALAMACWPDRDTLRPFCGMLIYGVLAALFLVYVGVTGRVGILLWPAVALHAALSLLLVRAWMKERRSVAIV